MKIEKLKKDNHKLVIGGLIIACISIFIITYTTTRAKYQNTEIIPLVNGVVNYKAYDFKVMAMYQQKDGQTCTEDSCYNTITTMPEEGYTINESKSYCTVDNKTHSNAILKTINGIHSFSKISKSDKCNIWFDKRKKITIDEAVSDATTTISDFSSIETGMGGIYTISDPMYGASAKTTYFRGAVANNWVKFGKHFWRIIRKNGDGSLRLIYSGTASGTDASKIPNVTIENNGAVAIGTGTQIGTDAYVTSNYNTNSFPTYVGWTYKTGSARPTNSNNSGAGASAAPINADTAPTSTTTEYRSTAYERTLTWFNDSNNLTEQERLKVADGKFCNDRMNESGENPGIENSTATYYFATHKRLETNKTPTLACTNAGDVYTTKVGLITADEVALAGGVWNVDNKSFYLYTSQNYWTMSPSYWNYSSTNSHYILIYIVLEPGALFNGAFYDDGTGTYSISGYVCWCAPGIRPVINLKDDVTFSGGSGLYNDPYIVA